MATITELQAIIVEKDALIAEQQAALAQKDALIAQHEEALSVKDAQIESLEAEQPDMENTINTQREQIVTLEAAVVDQDKQIQQLQAEKLALLNGATSSDIAPSETLTFKVDEDMYRFVSTKFRIQGRWMLASDALESEETLTLIVSVYPGLIRKI
jgi:hypothetical protein